MKKLLLFAAVAGFVSLSNTAVAQEEKVEIIEKKEAKEKKELKEKKESIHNHQNIAVDENMNKTNKQFIRKLSSNKSIKINQLWV